MKTPPEDDLEQWVHRELRRLPDCQAPDDLVGRVLEEVRRRQALPWWQQSLWHWPSTARWLLLTLLVSLSLTVVAIGTGVWSPFEIPVLPLQDWATSLLNAWNGFLPFPRRLAGWWGAQNLSTWLMGAGLFCALVYLLVVGIGSIFLQLTSPARPSHNTKIA
jgi:hypothetical protein